MTITINPFPKKPGDTGNPKVPSDLFTASGSGTGAAPGARMRKITFTLKTAGDSAVTMDNYHIHCEHRKDENNIEHLLWTIVFERVTAGNNYKLTVASGDDEEAAARATLDVVALKTLGERVVIQNPLTHATIPSDGFSPYGTTDLLLPIFAILTVPGASSVNGALVQGPPATPNWVFQFSHLPKGTGASLTVYQSSQGATATDLTIN